MFSNVHKNPKILEDIMKVDGGVSMF